MPGKPPYGKFEGRPVIGIRGKFVRSNDAIGITLDAAAPDGAMRHTGDIGYALIRYRVGPINFPEHKGGDPDNGGIAHDRQQEYEPLVVAFIDDLAGETAIMEQEARNESRRREIDGRQPLFEPNSLGGQVDAALADVEDWIPCQGAGKAMPDTEVNAEDTDAPSTICPICQRDVLVEPHDGEYLILAHDRPKPGPEIRPGVPDDEGAGETDNEE